MVTRHRIRFVGPPALAVRVATELADADGVELTSSAQPTAVDDTTVALELSVEGSGDDVRAAISSISGGLSAGATIEVR